MVELNLIKPKVDKVSDKYSWNFYKFCKKNKPYKVMSRVKENYIWNDLFIVTQEEFSYLYGKHLNTIMWDNRDLKVIIAYKELYPYDITVEFLENYIEIGRCLVVPCGTHEWKYNKEQTERCCVYCGKVEVKKYRQEEYWSGELND